MLNERLREIVDIFCDGILSGAYRSPNDLPPELVAEYRVLSEKYPPQLEDGKLEALVAMKALEDDECTRTGESQASLNRAFADSVDPKLKPFPSMKALLTAFKRFLEERQPAAAESASQPATYNVQ